MSFCRYAMIGNTDNTYAASERGFTAFAREFISIIKFGVCEKMARRGVERGSEEGSVLGQFQFFVFCKHIHKCVVGSYRLESFASQMCYVMNEHHSALVGGGMGLACAWPTPWWAAWYRLHFSHTHTHYLLGWLWYEWEYMWETHIAEMIKSYKKYMMSFLTSWVSSISRHFVARHAASSKPCSSQSKCFDRYR